MKKYLPLIMCITVLISSFFSIAAYADGAFTSTPIAPCGACRQVMLEVEQRYGRPIRIILYGTQGIYIIERGIRELLPLTFDASFLE